MNTEENRVEDYEALKEKGIPVWQTGPNTVLEGINLLWEMMDIFLETEHAFGVRLIEQKYDITKLAMENERPIKTFIPIWQDPWMTANQHTYMHDVMTLFGLENVFADRERQFPLDADMGDGEPLAEDDPRREGRDTRYPRVSLEEIEATQPELIFLPNEPYEFQETDAETFFNLDIPAAKLGNIYLVEGALFMWHGAHIAYAMSQLPPMLDEVRQRLTEQDEENNG